MKYTEDIVKDIKTNNLKLKDISISDRIQLINSAIFTSALKEDIEDAMMDIGEWFDDRMCDLSDDLDNMEMVQLMSNDNVGQVLMPAPNC